jgi:lipoprotein-anchoring transpeptidase ErfK/SrfK
MVQMTQVQSVGMFGGYVTSGCFRLANADVLELYGTVLVGTKIVVRD